jgi:hypothetical protein
VEVNLQSINVGESSGLEAGRDEAGACRYIQHLKMYGPWNNFVRFFFKSAGKEVCIVYYIKVEKVRLQALTDH